MTPTPSQRLADAEAPLHELRDRVDLLMWIIAVARQDLWEGAPDRAKRFLKHQMKLLGHD